MEQPHHSATKTSSPSSSWLTSRRLPPGTEREEIPRKHVVVTVVDSVAIVDAVAGDVAVVDDVAVVV